MIVAVDFDGTLVENKFPKIGKPHKRVINLVQKLSEKCELVLWTSRVDRPLKSAIKFCEDYGIKFAAINDNAPSNKKMYEKKYPNGTRKVSADVYVDDHSIEYFGRDHKDVTKRIEIELKRLLKEV